MLIQYHFKWLILPDKMKNNRTRLFIITASVALLLVLIIQVNWIFETARVKEEMFNEKANMILARTTDAMRHDPEICGNIDKCVNENSTGFTTKLGKNELHKIDSLFNYYMHFYNFQIDYSFEVAKPKAPFFSSENVFARSVYQQEKGCYVKNLEDITSTNGVELKLIFPEKRQYIISEMGTLFIASIILILVVLILFWRTVSLLVKEQKMLEHLTDFLNNMTHEFKTPLTNIALAGKMILKEGNLKQEDKIKHYSEIILEENEKLRLQVEQVLNMAALERGEMLQATTQVDIHGLINDAVKSMSMQLESKAGSLLLKLDAENYLINGDKTQLTNAMCNLIDNSIKYAADAPYININTYNSDKQLIIKFADNGIGIETEYAQKVFDKYFRIPTGNVHNVKGVGLGLAYVKKIIELHKGTIELQSEKTKGTTFIITLPNA